MLFPIIHGQRGSAIRAGVLAAILAAGCHSGPATPATAGATVAPPRILVTVVVDQLAAWIAAERWPALPPEGGFARLRREGTYVREIRYEHSVNDTAPGHAALYSGAAPQESGISSNEVIPPEGGAAKGIL